MSVKNAINTLEAWRDNATLMLHRCEVESEGKWRNQRDNYQAVIDQLTQPPERCETHIRKGIRMADYFIQNGSLPEGMLARALPADIAFAAARITFNHGQEAIRSFCECLDRVGKVVDATKLNGGN